MAKTARKPPKRSQSFFFYRKEVLKTTWKFRLLSLLVVIAIIVLPYRFWARQISYGLLCKQQIEPSDALLVENFDVNYDVFQRAASLQKAALAPRVLVPSLFTLKRSGTRESSMQVTRFVAQVAKLEAFEIIPVQEIEPITQNAARQIREYLEKEHIKSVLVVTPGFRSRRSEMIYGVELAEHGIRVGCAPVFSSVDPENWTSTWHGMQQIFEQFFKLQYYRFWVLR